MGPIIESACITPLDFETKKFKDDWECMYVTEIPFLVQSKTYPGLTMISNGTCSGKPVYQYLKSTDETTLKTFEFKLHEEDSEGHYVSMQSPCKDVKKGPVRLQNFQCDALTLVDNPKIYQKFSKFALIQNSNDLNHAYIYNNHCEFTFSLN